MPPSRSAHGGASEEAANDQALVGNAAVAQGLGGSGMWDAAMAARKSAAPQGGSSIPVTQDASPQAWDLLHQEGAAFEASPTQSVLDATSDAGALDSGKILAATAKRDDGMIEERTVGAIDVPFGEFVKKVFPADWGKNLYGLVGGEVEELERDDQGRPARQQERMVLETPASHYLSWLGGLVPALQHLDMTKTEEVSYGKDSATVRWRVYQSDNETVAQDIGSVEFRAAGNKTMVTFHSAHKYTGKYTFPFNFGPLKRVSDMLTARGLKDYFVNAIEHYRELGGA